MFNGSWVEPCRWTDMTNLIVTFHNFVNASKNILHAYYTTLIIITNTLKLLYHWQNKLNQAPSYLTVHIYSMYLLIFLFYFSCDEFTWFSIPRINLFDMNSKSHNAMFMIVLLCFIHYAYCIQVHSWCLHAKHHILNPVLHVTATTPKESVHTAPTITLHSTKNYHSRSFAQWQGLLPHITSDPKTDTNLTSQSQVTASTILLLLMTGN